MTLLLSHVRRRERAACVCRRARARPLVGDAGAREYGISAGPFQPPSQSRCGRWKRPGQDGSGYSDAAVGTSLDVDGCRWMNFVAEGEKQGYN